MANSTNVDVDLVRHQVMMTVSYFEHLMTAVQAIKGLEHIEAAEVTRKAMWEALGGHQERMEHQAWQFLKLVCGTLGMDYDAATQGDVELVGEANG